eukprot:SAG31_NODE_397_length_16251_cov_7.922486_11_plen_81_part_00
MARRQGIYDWPQLQNFPSGSRSKSTKPPKSQVPSSNQLPAEGRLLKTVRSEKFQAREGVLREYEKLHGLWIDHVCLSLLR